MQVIHVLCKNIAWQSFVCGLKSLKCNVVCYLSDFQICSWRNSWVIYSMGRFCSVNWELNDCLSEKFTKRNCTLGSYMINNGTEKHIFQCRQQPIELYFYYNLCSGGNVFACVCSVVLVGWFCLCVCLSVGLLKTTEWISTRLGWRITTRINPINFWCKYRKGDRILRKRFFFTFFKTTDND